MRQGEVLRLVAIILIQMKREQIYFVSSEDEKKECRKIYKTMFFVLNLFICGYRTKDTECLHDHTECVYLNTSGTNQLFY